MQAEDVVELYNLILSNNIKLWIDGGWCVDALLGKQTREHPDLDIAVKRESTAKLHELLIANNYFHKPTLDASEFNYVMEDPDGKLIDVHVFDFDEKGNNTYGIEYPISSLKGIGSINGKTVMCISPEWIYKFKTSYEPKDKDIKDVQALSKKFGYELPERYQTI